MKKIVVTKSTLEGAAKRGKLNLECNEENKLDQFRLTIEGDFAVLESLEEKLSFSHWLEVDNNQVYTVVDKQLFAFSVSAVILNKRK